MEIRRIFFANWTLLDYADRFSDDGNCRLYEVAMRSLVVVRNNARQFHCVRNRCLHAAYPVLLEDKVDTGDKLTCTYHGWQYSLDGKLLYAPHLNSGPSADVGLTRYGVELHDGLLYLAPISDSLTRSPEEFLVRSQNTNAPPEFHVEQFSIEANWKKLAWILNESVQAAFNLRSTDIQTYGALNLYISYGEGSAIIRLIPFANKRTKLTITQTQPLNRPSAPSQASSKLEHYLRAAIKDEALSIKADQETALAEFHKWYLATITSCTPKEINE
ncbi:Rieske 2Fe-2S domain-containing protein [Pusillimonas sp.]|uniref:Rieske 2Fe-2S domain-containing protein n=1 Tax=Pusillimonas sp. TaxID=3040095 RepID=UPI0037CA5D5E